MSDVQFQEWLKLKISGLLGIKADAVDVTEPFVSYGLDSVASITLSSELEDLIKVKLPPTLVWDYPNIATLAKYLASLPHAAADLPRSQKTG